MPILRIFQKQLPEVSYEKRLFLKTFTGKSQTCYFIKKRLQHRCFPLNIAKLLRTPILEN